MSKELGRFQREIMEICEFYVDDKDNKPKTNTIFQKSMDGKMTLNNPTQHLRDYLSIQGVVLPDNIFRTGNPTPTVKPATATPTTPTQTPPTATVQNPTISRPTATINRVADTI